ncbi:tetratricopeptide repeat protein [Balneicella halophila]|uniref:Tetratricopeptide repeat protein n=1 Tax=Balneicella halophila TaxID=1537566 RepID=A0A7L4URX2_BALHA|nr:LuxR family transcriptional regulator [Balneicella halophila]PVX52513.1 tetratricopeptide repeat protein [Balneicella halophila]
MKRLLNLVFVLLIITLENVIAQNKQIEVDTDSTFTALINSPNTKLKVDNLINLFKNASRNKYVDYNIIDSAINIGTSLAYTEGVGRAYQQKGLIARYNYDYYTAIQNHKLALNYLLKTADTLETIKCLNSLGIAYRKVNITDKSFDYYFKAHTLAEKFSIPSQAIALNGIGNLFTDAKKYNIALYFFKKALNLEIASNNKRGMEYDYANIGEAFLFLNKYDSAHYYTDKALELSKNNGKKDTHGPELSLLGKIYQKQEKFRISNLYYNEASVIHKRRGNKRYLSNALVNIGINKIALKQTEQGLISINQGLNIAEEIGSKENALAAYNTLSTYYSRVGKYREALNYYRKASLFKDSIFNEFSQKTLINAQIAYETKDKEKRIEQLATESAVSQQKARQNHKRMIYSLVIGTILLVSFLIILYLFRKNSRLKVENLNKKLQNYMLQLDDNINKNNISYEEKIKPFNLSEREAQVLKLILKGLSNDEIAKQLFVSKNTVKYHSKNIYSKLDVRSRIEAMKKIEIIK